jgi:hypothetical protein
MAVRQDIIDGKVKLTPVFNAEDVRKLMSSVEIGTAQ